MEKLLETLLSEPKTATVLIKGVIDTYKPVVYEVAKELVQVYKDYSENEEYPTIVAKVKKNMYDAYVAVGFTEDQALALMINDNIQMMKGLKDGMSMSSASSSVKK